MTKIEGKIMSRKQKDDERWLKNYELAKKYYNYYGNLNVYQKFKTSDGYTEDKNGANLGGWILRQRQNYEMLSDERKQKLNEIGFVLNVYDENWSKNYELAKKYYEHHCDLLIPNKFKTSDGYTYDENGVRLGEWINSQRNTYKTLSRKRKQKLNEIGFVLSASDENWSKNYELAKKYYEYHGDLLMPVKFKTSDGYTYDEEGVKLGNWIMTQKCHYKVLLDERKQKLSEIGFVLNIIDGNWSKNYELAKKYYEHHGNLLIPVKFKTSDGYTEDKNGVKLGSWIFRQRQNYKILSEERKQELNEIGFVLNVYDENWSKNYELAKKYYEHHGDLLITVRFKTSDGYTYDEAGVKLGNWIMNQRQGYEKLSEERKILLSSIGMVWNTKKNREKINDICLQNDIDELKNKSILSRITFQELSSKIEFVKSYNILPVDKNGLLIDIFSMNNIDMQEKYGISLEELISEYYISKDKIKKL